MHLAIQPGGKTEVIQGRFLYPLISALYIELIEARNSRFTYSKLNDTGFVEVLVFIDSENRFNLITQS